MKMNTLLLITTVLSCPLSLKAVTGTNNYCQLRKHRMTHEQFVTTICDSPFLVREFEKTSIHRKNKDNFECSPKYVKVQNHENRDFEHRHCERVEDRINNLHSFTNHETDQFCQSYSEQFSYEKIQAHEIANLCKPYYLHNSKLEERQNLDETQKKEFNQECCHQRIQNKSNKLPYSIDCVGNRSSSKSADTDSSEKYTIIISYKNSNDKNRITVRAHMIKQCSLHIR